MSRWHGLFPATYTPMHADGSINLDAVEPLAALLIESRVQGVFVNGTTGESLSLTVDERFRLAQRWVEVVGRDLTVIIHVGANAMPEACAMAEHARKVGAHAVAAMAPTFFRPQNVEQLIDYCQPIARAAGDVPFFFYDIPSMTGVTLPIDQFLESAPARVPSLKGLKFTRNDLVLYQTCRAIAGDALELMWGYDELLICALAVGANGAVGSTYNYAAPLYHKAIDAFRRGDHDAARRHQAQSVQLVRAMLRGGIIPAGKAILDMLGIPVGPARPPLKSLTDEQRRQLHRDIASMDVFPRLLKKPTV